MMDLFFTWRNLNDVIKKSYREKWRWRWKLWKIRKWKKDLLEKAETSQTWIQNWNHLSKHRLLLKQRSRLLFRNLPDANSAYCFFFLQPPWYIVFLVHKSLQDHEVYCMAQIQVGFSGTDPPSAGCPVPWDLVLFTSCKNSTFISQLMIKFSPKLVECLFAFTIEIIYLQNSSNSITLNFLFFTELHLNEDREAFLLTKRKQMYFCCNTSFAQFFIICNDLKHFYVTGILFSSQNDTKSSVIQEL